MFSAPLCLKEKIRISRRYAGNCSNDRKCRKSPVEEVYTLMWEWVKTARDQEILISYSMLRAKAKMF